MKNDILLKIEKAGLVGRGGAEYPTAKKWQEVGRALGAQKFVVCNASEGEIGLFKDLYILKTYPEMVVKGVILALDFLGSKDAFFNLNKRYFKMIGSRLAPIIKKYNHQGYNIKIFVEEPSYIGGEETALLNAIEGKRTEPRQKPPYPSNAGLYGAPTLINNVETLYNIACVHDGTFANKRFYCLSKSGKKIGVYYLPDNWDIEKILKETKNYPNYKFFVQVGGSASGIVFDESQIKGKLATGAAALDIHNKNEAPRKVLLNWLKFYQQESCGKCTPCRVGTFELYEMVKKNKNIPWKEMFEILETMDATSFCALGRSVSVPIRSYYSNVLKLK